MTPKNQIKHIKTHQQYKNKTKKANKMKMKNIIKIIFTFKIMFKISNVTKTNSKTKKNNNSNCGYNNKLKVNNTLVQCLCPLRNCKHQCCRNNNNNNQFSTQWLILVCLHQIRYVISLNLCIKKILWGWCKKTLSTKSTTHLWYAKPPNVSSKFTNNPCKNSF